MNCDTLLYSEVEFDDARQIINMGGPYIGGLLIRKKLIAKDCVVDNFVIDKTANRLFFVKYHHGTGFMNRAFFTINFYKLEDQALFQFKKHFNAIYLKDIKDDSLEITRLSMNWRDRNGFSISRKMQFRCKKRRQYAEFFHFFKFPALSLQISLAKPLHFITNIITKCLVD